MAFLFVQNPADCSRRQLSSLFLKQYHIRLDADDDPQLIFESLNSTGLDLSEADKIRNYLLMSLSTTEQDDLYNRFLESYRSVYKV